MNDATEVVVGADGRVLVAPAGGATTYPETLAALAPEWVEVGYITEDGVNFVNGQDVEGVPAWQSFYDLRKLVTGKNTSVEFGMRQWNPVTIKLAFGGGTVSEAGNVATYIPPEPGTIDYRAMVIEWEDGGYTFRLVIPRGQVTGEVSSQITRTAASDLPISFEATPEGSPDADVESNPWYFLTDHPAFLTT